MSAEIAIESRQTKGKRRSPFRSSSLSFPDRFNFVISALGETEQQEAHGEYDHRAD
jgi:hypothetical protein